MRYRTKATRWDMLTAVGSLAFLLLNLGAFDGRGRAQAKKIVCLTNVRQLAHAWLLFANDNDDKLVNGAAGYSNANFSWGDHTGEVAWVDSITSNPEDAIRGIRDGALWSYLKDHRIYRCPAALRNEMLTYAIMFSMNAVCHPEVQGVPGAHVKKLSEIQNPDRRLVFIDEGRVTPDAFAVRYSLERWWDGPPIRHSDGTTVSFADGHSEHWKWKGIDTVRYGWETENSGARQRMPETEQGFRDLYTVQIGCWGQLGYEPTH